MACRLLRAMASRSPTCNRREIFLVMPPASEMDLPAINSRTDRSTMSLHLQSRVPLLRRPHPILRRPSTSLLFRAPMPKTRVVLPPQKSNQTSRPRPLHRRLKMGNTLIPKPSRDRGAANRTPLPRVARTRQIHGMRNANRTKLEQGEADSPAILDRNVRSLRLPARNWFVGEFLRLHAGRSS